MNKTILELFRRGNCRVKLAIIADIVTIAGVSIASIFGGILAITKNIGTLSGMDIFGVALLSLLGLFIFSLCTAGFIYAMTYLSSQLSKRGIIKDLIMVSAFALLLFFMLIIAMTYYQVFLSLPAFR
nr:hypothetical protein [Providencia stuartii]